MGGSSGGGSRPRPPSQGAGSGVGVGGGSGGSDPCAIAETYTLQGPRRDVLEQLIVGSQLDLTTRQQGTAQIVVCLNRRSGALAGTLPREGIDQLITCLNFGVEFKATVIRLDGGRCDVRVERA